MAVLLAVVVVSILAAVATTNGRRVSPAPLAHATASLEALGRAVLEAARAGDLAALGAVALTEQEFRDHVWPYLPISEPRRNFPFDFVWDQLQQHSDGHLRQTLARYRGHGLMFVGVEFAGATSSYHGAAVHRRTALRVRDEDGREHLVRLFGSTIEQDGRYKVFSYVVDD
jgi:hypothetical protein